MATDQIDDSPAVFEGNQLIYAGRYSYIVPRSLYDHKEETRRLDISFNYIRDLEELSAFTKLEELVLDSNDVTEKTIFPELKELRVLSLCKNKITDLYAFLDQLEGKFPKLNFLSLLGNQACPDALTRQDCDEADYARYRKYILYKLPTLRFLDSKPVLKEELKESKRVGPYLRPVKPMDDSLMESMSGDATAYNPLPASSMREDSQPKGTFSKTKYAYKGRHSEGNRFIRNDDL